jgi:hypothetical protein
MVRSPDPAVRNPWADVPISPPYIAAVDREVVDKVLGFEPGGRRDLRFDALPHPFAGNPDRARVVLLALNPGWAETDPIEEGSVAEWRDQLRENLVFGAATPFVHVDPRFRSVTGGGRWWSKRLRVLADATSWEAVGDRVMCLEFFGYHSLTWRSLPVPLPSQAFAFYLLRQQMARGTLIVVTRGWSPWVWNVPELYTYPSAIRLHSQRWVGLSAGNMGDANFRRLVEAVG